MKKIFLIILMLLMVGCGQVVKQKEVIENEPETIEEEPKEEYIDNNPITVGLYYKGKLVHEFNKKFKDRTDIATFNVFFTNKEDLGSTNVKTNWKKYYDQYENIKDYKIGFEIKVEINGEMQENVLLDPSNQFKIYQYLYAYLYDGYHAKGKYTHLSMEDLNEDTVYTSIKLYLHNKSKEITSPIYLTVFTYKDENDFIDGHYRGNSKYSIIIYNK